MKTIEIKLNMETGKYTIEETFQDKYYQGLTTDDLNEALLYIENLMEDLKHDNDR